MSSFYFYLKCLLVYLNLQIELSEMLWLSWIVLIIKHDNWNVRERDGGTVGVDGAVRSTQSTIDTIRATMGPVVWLVEVEPLVTSQGVIQSQR